MANRAELDELLKELLARAERAERGAVCDTPKGCIADTPDPGFKFANNFIHEATGLRIAGPVPQCGNGWSIGNADSDGFVIARTLELAVAMCPFLATLPEA